jgi:hypothetical protein
MKTTDPIWRYRFLSGATFAIICICSANFIFDWGLFGELAKYVMLGSFLAGGVVLYVCLGAAIDATLENSPTEFKSTEEYSPGAHPFGKRIGLGLIFWTVVLVAPILWWSLTGSPGGWSTLFWYELIAILSASVFLRRVGKAGFGKDRSK